MKMKTILRRTISFVVMLTMLLGLVPFSATASAETEDEWIEASIFYIYSNEVPDNISRDEKDALFGPMGNGKSSTVVKVNLTQLEKLGYERGLYGRRTIYSVENDNTNGVVEPKNEHNTEKALAPDSQVRVFWRDLYSCMDDESKQLVSDVYNNKFIGYVLKNVSYKGNNFHIDGIIDIKAIPTYQIEIYDKSNENEIAYVNSTDSEETYADVKGYIEECLKKDADNFTIGWKSETEAVYVKDGKGYSLSVTQKTPAGAVIESGKVNYSRITKDYYLARFIIASKELPAVYNVTLTDDEGNELKTMTSGQVTDITDENVPKMTNIKAAVEEVLAGDGKDVVVNWDSREYIKDLNVYSFDTEYVTNTVSGPGLVVVNNTDEAGDLYYEYSGEEEGVIQYKAVLKLNTTLKTTMRKVKLYVLKKELSNIEYGYDVSNDSIRQRSQSDFTPFGTAYMDDSYLQSLKKHPGSFLRGEIINEVLYDYDYATGDYTAKGELTDLNKIIKYIAYDSDNAKELVNKINDNYNICWYVIKDVKTDDWHIDGYLCKETNPDSRKIKVTVNHVTYDTKEGGYSLLKDSSNNDMTETTEVDANTLFSSRSKYPKAKKNDEKKITIDGALTDWDNFPEFWIPVDYGKLVEVDTSKGKIGGEGLAGNSMVKLHNDKDDQMVYIYMKVSDMYGTYFKTDEFKISVNNDDYELEFKVGDIDGNIINGDISDMGVGVHTLYIYDKKGNRIASGLAKMVIGKDHMNTTIEMAVPYYSISRKDAESGDYNVVCFEKESGSIIKENSDNSYDDEMYLMSNTQLASEDTILRYVYAREKVVDSVKFGTITIEGGSTGPYLLAGIGFVIALAGFSGVSFKRKRNKTLV